MILIRYRERNIKILRVVRDKEMRHHLYLPLFSQAVKLISGAVMEEE
jgi:hypothetical protein